MVNEEVLLRKLSKLKKPSPFVKGRPEGILENCSEGMEALAIFCKGVNFERN